MTSNLRLFLLYCLGFGILMLGLFLYEHFFENDPVTLTDIVILLIFLPFAGFLIWFRADYTPRVWRAQRIKELREKRENEERDEERDA